MVSHEFSFLGAKKTLFTTLQSAVHPWQHVLVSKAFGKRVGRQHAVPVAIERALAIAVTSVAFCPEWF